MKDINNMLVVGKNLVNVIINKDQYYKIIPSLFCK